MTRSFPRDTEDPSYAGGHPGVWNCQNCRADREGWKQEVRHDRGSVLLRQDYLFPQAVHSAGGARNEATSYCC